jgi:hypothetical protein
MRAFQMLELKIDSQTERPQGRMISARSLLFILHLRQNAPGSRRDHGESVTNNFGAFPQRASKIICAAAPRDNVRNRYNPIYQK